MTSNETSVSADVLPQDGDDLSETNLTRTAAKSNLTDYVERGLGFNADFAAGTVDIGSGHAIIQDGVNAYDLFPSQIADLSLPSSSGVNHVFVAIQPGTDDAAYYHIDDTDDPPADPSIKIGTVDTANNTADDTINRRPDVELGNTDIDALAAALDANGQDIQNVGAFDGDSLSTGEVSGDLRAGPGELQKKIDEAYNSGGGVVIGDPSQAFDPEQTIEVKPDVTLIVRGKGVVTSSDINLFAMHERSNLIAQVDTTGVTYTSNWVTIDTANTGKLYTNRSAPTVKLEGIGTKGEGTALYLHQNATDDALSFVEADVRIDEIGTGVDLHSENSGGWINGNRIQGFIRGAETMLSTRGAGTITGNWFTLDLQPFGSSNAGGASSLGWDCQAGGSNVFEGMHWDNDRYNTAYARFGSGADAHNVVAPSLNLNGTQITDNSSYTQHAWRPTRPNKIYEIGAGDWAEWELSGDRLTLLYYDAESGTTDSALSVNDYQVRAEKTFSFGENNLARPPTGSTTSDPTTDTPANWIPIIISGNTRYIPVYS